VAFFRKATVLIERKQVMSAAADEKCSLPDCVRNLYRFRYRGRFALIGLFLFLLFSMSFLLIDPLFRASTDPTLVDLQLAFNSMRFHDIIAAWNKSIDGGIEMYKLSIMLLDYLYPVIYSAMLAFAYAVVRKNDQPTHLDKVLFTLPFIAAIFDYIENTIHLLLLKDVHNLAQAMAVQYPPSAVAISAAASVLKFLFFYAAIFAFLGAVFYRIKKRFA
jgi:hypothetical protein